MRKVALLGSGYIGKGLIVPLKKKGYLVRVSTLTPSKVAELESLADEVVLLESGSHEEIAQFLSGCDGLVVTVAPKGGSDYQTTYLETARAVREAAPKLENLVYTSSTSVYGSHDGGWVDELTTAIPETSNGEVLLRAEQAYLEGFPFDTHVCVLRLGGIYGPGREIEKRLERMAGMSLPGTGESYTNLIHRDDAVMAILWALEHDLSGAYNLVEDTHIPRKELYATLSSRHNLPEVTWDGSQASTHAGNKRVSNAKIKSTGFRFEHEFA